MPSVDAVLRWLDQNLFSSDHRQLRGVLNKTVTERYRSSANKSSVIQSPHTVQSIHDSDLNKNVDIEFSAYDAFLE
jgi:hypothetical protein